MTRFLTRESLAGLANDLIASGTRVIAPARAEDGGIDYRAITGFDEAAVDTVLPRRSLRAAFQPPTEPLLGWRRKDTSIALAEAALGTTPQVVLGARPCDAAGAAILDSVMGWDYRDDLWFARREATTILTLGCREMDPSCFCDRLGLGPASPDGSDVLLHTADGGYLAEVVTEKGAQFLDGHARWFQEPPPLELEPTPRREALPLPSIRQWLESHFDDALWQEMALRCLGCGACTSVCPTCHCFDIVDEPDGSSAGVRRRNWDTCQAALFTLHASGHNPRPDQTARCRQRVMHKFAIYPARFNRVLCTGCGRCTRACPAGVNLPEILDAIAARLAADTDTGGPA